MSRVVLALLLLGIARPALADDPIGRRPTPFDRGQLWIGVGGGTQTQFGHRYYAVGASVGYFVVDGLEIALGGVEQFGSGPNIAQLSPAVRYVVQPLVGVWPVVPYVGAFYNHWFVSDSINDVDTLGARAGLLYVSGKFVVGLGVAYEQLVSECTTNCSAVYPDITLAFSL